MSHKNIKNLIAASANDMTGLTPTIAHDNYEADSYEEVYPYLPSSAKKEYSSNPAFLSASAPQRKQP